MRNRHVRNEMTAKSERIVTVLPHLQQMKRGQLWWTQLGPAAWLPPPAKPACVKQVCHKKHSETCNHQVIHRIISCKRAHSPRHTVIVKLLHMMHCIRQSSYATYVCIYVHTVHRHVRSTTLMYIPGRAAMHEHAAITAIVVRTRKGSEHCPCSERAERGNYFCDKGTSSQHI